MKTLILPLLILCLVCFSCGGNQSSQTESEGVEITNENQEETGSFEKAKDCDEFVDQYEKWMDDYLVLLEKYMKNPLDQSLSQEYIQQAQKLSSWAEQWSTGFAMCAANEKYSERFEKISEKAEKKLAELGLE